jgi:hypothetical protein
LNKFLKRLSSSGVAPSLQAGEPNFLDEFILIGRNFKHWQACNNAAEAKSEELTPLILKLVVHLFTSKGLI